ncbi:hypothetical protein [Brevundimonas sp. SL161]|uniref:hypothetical protein n=1 Tax=Brevundimonas sp. SL161 TaxID=2804613 RepID=UPI003CF1BFE7
MVRPILAATVLIRPSIPGACRRLHAPDDRNRRTDLPDVDDRYIGGVEDIPCVVPLNTRAALLD